MYIVCLRRLSKNQISGHITRVQSKSPKVGSQIWVEFVSLVYLLVGLCMIWQVKGHYPVGSISLPIVDVYSMSEKIDT